MKKEVISSHINCAGSGRVCFIQAGSGFRLNSLTRFSSGETIFLFRPLPGQNYFYSGHFLVKYNGDLDAFVHAFWDLIIQEIDFLVGF